jgi:hypothetical protein
MNSLELPCRKCTQRGLLTVVQTTIKNDHENCLHAYICNFDAELREKYGRLFAPYCVECKSLKCLKYFINNGYTLRHSDKTMITAITKNDMELLQFAIKNKAPFPENYYSLALENNALDALGYCVDHGAPIMK